MVAACLLTVTGCTPTSAPSASPPAATTGSSTAAAFAGEIGAATFSATDGTTGTIRLSARDGRLALTSDDLAIAATAESSTGAFSVVGALDPIDGGASCFDVDFPLRFADAMPGEPYKAWRNLADFEGDPTAIDQLVLTTPVQSDPDCAATVVAVAEIGWSVVPLRSDLVAVDSGPRAAAHGETTVRDGVPTSYRVARNDLAEDVARRFGISADDLFYLNPFRSPSNEILRVGEQLNLTVAAR